MFFDLDSGKARGHLDLVHLRPAPPASPQSQSGQFKLRSVDSSSQLQQLVQQRMLQQKRNLFHRHRGGEGSPTPGSANGSMSFDQAYYLPRHDNYKLAQRLHYHYPQQQQQQQFNHQHNHYHRQKQQRQLEDDYGGKEKDDDRWKSLPSRLAADCQLAERTLLWSQQVKTS